MRLSLFVLLFLFCLSFVAAEYSDPRDGFSVSDSVQVMDTAVYSTGYMSPDGSSWSSFSLEGESFGSWVLGEAQSDVVPDDARYFAVFSCSWVGSWDCSSTWQVLDRGERDEDSQGDSDYVPKDSLEGDFEALRDLYESTNGDEWFDNQGWPGMTPQTMGDAIGIETDDDGRVVRIDMQKVTSIENNRGGVQDNGNNLQGELPRSIGNLQRVEYFNVKQNRIGGEIPSTIGYMRSLKQLLLAGQRGEVSLGWGNSADHRGQGNGKAFEETNMFTGDLPGEIGSLSNLEIIEIRRQFLTGSLPPEWGDLGNIKGIFINHQRGEDSLSGPLPPEWGGMTQLQNLDLTHGPADRDVGVVEYGQPFTGEIPQEWIDGISHDENAAFRFSGNEFVGSVPYFENLRNFRVLSFANNNFSGSFPIEYFDNGNNAFINLFAVNGNQLSGTIPEITTRPSFPQSRDNYNTISVFRLGGNSFSGPIPEWIQDMRGHIQVSFSNVGFSGPFPKKIAEKPKVRIFFIDSNNFSGPLPDVNWSSNDLYGLTMGGNNFSGPIPDSWSSMQQGTRGVWRLYLNSMELEGPIPKWFGEIYGSGGNSGPQTSGSLVVGREYQITNYRGDDDFTNVGASSNVEGEVFVATGSTPANWDSGSSVGRLTFERLYIQNNRFTYKDILPHYDYLQTRMNIAGEMGRGSVNRYYVAPQKPFNVPQEEYDLSVGDSVTLDLSFADYAGNEYQWYEVGEGAVAGETSHTLTLDDVQESAQYYLRITNPALTGRPRSNQNLEESLSRKISLHVQ